MRHLPTKRQTRQWLIATSLIILVSGCANLKPKLQNLLPKSSRPAIAEDSSTQSVSATDRQQPLAQAPQTQANNSFQTPSTNPLRQQTSSANVPDPSRYSQQNGQDIQQVGYQEELPPPAGSPAYAPQQQTTQPAPIGSGTYQPSPHTSAPSHRMPTPGYSQTGESFGNTQGPYAQQNAMQQFPSHGNGYPSSQQAPFPSNNGYNNPSHHNNNAGVQYPRNEQMAMYREANPDRIVHTRGNELFPRQQMASERALELFDENKALKHKIEKLLNQLDQKDEEIADLNKSREMLWREITEFRKQIEQLEAKNNKTQAQLRLAILEKENFEKNAIKMIDDIESLVDETINDIPMPFQRASDNNK